MVAPVLQSQSSVFCSLQYRKDKLFHSTHFLIQIYAFDIFVSISPHFCPSLTLNFHFIPVSLKKLLTISMISPLTLTSKYRLTRLFCTIKTLLFTFLALNFFPPLTRPISPAKNLSCQVTSASSTGTDSKIWSLLS